jgi:hypothetical protein
VTGDREYGDEEKYIFCVLRAYFESFVVKKHFLDNPVQHGREINFKSMAHLTVCRLKDVINF